MVKFYKLIKYKKKNLICWLWKCVNWKDRNDTLGMNNKNVIKIISPKKSH